MHATFADTPWGGAASGPGELDAYFNEISYGKLKVAAAEAVVSAVDHALERGESASLVGPSGCGKSTLLNIIAGFIPPSAGEIVVDGRQVAGQVPPALGYIFQKDTLLPWYTVQKNIALGLRFQGVS